MNHKTWISMYLAAVFGALGVHFVYLQIYLRDHGFSYQEIGFFLALIPLVAMVVSPVWGMIADSSSDPRRILRILLVLIPMCHLPLLLGGGFWVCLAVCICIALFYQPLIPIQDSLVLRALHIHGGDYGRLRIWGSIGFTIPALFLSVFWGHSSMGAINWTAPGLLFAAYSAAAFALSHALPPVPPERKHGLSAAGFHLLEKPTFLVLMGSVFLARVASSSLEGYQGVYLEELGVPVEQLALFVALGPLSEVFTIFYSQRWLARIGARKLMAICLGALVVRLAVTAGSQSWPVLVGVQALHCLTFGTQHVVTVLVVNQLAGDSIRASAQTLATVFSNYLSRLVGLSAAGWIAQHYALQGLFGVAAGIAALSLALWWILYRDTEDADLKRGVR
ncbi:MAG: MFS transporter [Candidatus Omnitrophica bacterium]|nr:putative 3-phenylpropionic acid transporter [bacterium]NUN94922.1 MFS transporter [Candidatus Omnitrophota bacterium]